jgi:putative tryptophan/tyrosine transport system substrate-binding protein
MAPLQAIRTRYDGAQAAHRVPGGLADGCCNRGSDRVLDRRTFVLGCVAALAAPPTVEAQHARSVRTIGFFGPPPTAGGLLQAFQQGLRDLGYVENQNIRIEYRYTDVALAGQPQLFPRLATELVNLRPEVLVVSVTEAAVAVRNTTSTIPIVMVNVPDPVGAGLVSSLARPGGNVTGLSRQSREILGKNFQLVTEAIPTARRLGVLVGGLANSKNPLNLQMVADAKEAAKSLDLELIIVEVETPADIPRALRTMKSDQPSAVVVLGGAGFYLNRAEIAAQTVSNRLPAMFQNREFVEAGGLIAYAPNTVENYRRAAFFVDKILKGAKPADLPIEQPTKFELVINLKTAKALGLTIPPSLLLRADQVIE